MGWAVAEHPESLQRELWQWGAISFQNGTSHQSCALGGTVETEGGNPGGS